MKLRRLSVFMLCALVALSACGSSEDENKDPNPSLDASITTDASTEMPDAGEVDAGVIDEPPTVTVLEPGPYAGLVSQIEIKVDASDDHGVAKVELFVGDNPEPVRGRIAAPWELTLDATGMEKGVSSFFVRATDTAGNTTDTEPIPIILAAGGQEVKKSGSLAIPANYDPASGLDVDSKHHWTNQGETHIAAVLEWQVPDGQEPWELELSVGWGECPHAGGTVGNAETSTTSPIFVLSEESGSYPTTMRFVHIRPADATFHKGETLPYETRVYVW
ncbi:MAG: Ig-like domain-containing protein [Myxococcales bacterium]|jgi:hypothetical protein